MERILRFILRTFFNCTVRKMQMSQQKYRSSRCLRICLLRSTSEDRSAPQTAQLTLVSGAVPLACARRCLWNAFSIVHAYEHSEHRYSSLSYLSALRNERWCKTILHERISLFSIPFIPLQILFRNIKLKNSRRDIGYVKLFEYLYLTRCKASERFFPVGVIPWATCAATWVSISHLLLVVKSQPVDGHLLVSPVSVPDSAGWQSAMCFLRAGLVGAITSHEPHE